MLRERRVHAARTPGVAEMMALFAALAAPLALAAASTGVICFQPRPPPEAFATAGKGAGAGCR
jgi:hypothetical protein